MRPHLRALCPPRNLAFSKGSAAPPSGRTIAALAEASPCAGSQPRFTPLHARQETQPETSCPSYSPIICRHAISRSPPVAGCRRLAWTPKRRSAPCVEPAIADAMRCRTCPPGRRGRRRFRRTRSSATCNSPLHRFPSAIGARCGSAAHLRCLCRMLLRNTGREASGRATERRARPARVGGTPTPPRRPCRPPRP